MNDSRQWVAMGYIKGAFGIKGWVKVAANTEYPDSLLDYAEWRLVKDGQINNVAVESGKLVGGELQVKFEGVDDRDIAHALRGYTIEIPREEFAPVEEDEYYWADLVGMEVFNRDGVSLGKVENLMETGAHDVLMVNGSHGKKLIPFVSHYIDRVDFETQSITVDWGLDY
ncbi:ribosome maturation factor RimM [Neisseria wadsworthii]|uniref:Ribosome maturation factor RimM n=1 Tax=Neisseria wadsworthii 9715 TaxID=1030841 RepID=G4CP13_9NEIS|nr:ribosome maturation factor RimM [Neisseria wadsworthii]EGZ48527.1 16S rRNA processing protein RimM [Neisseria wadsworthii 9715]